MPAAKRSGNPAVRNAQDTKVVDLDARRAGVREAKGDHVLIRLGGQDFHGAVEIPLTFGYAMMQMDVPTAVHALFEDEGEAEAFLALNPTVEDLGAIMEAGYGIEVGGILGLTGILDEHYSVLEADFQRFYGLNLGDLIAFGGARRILNLFRHLPPEAQFASTFTHGWDDAQELRAAQVEVTHALYRATLAAHGSKRVPRQIKIPRPSAAKAAVAKRAASPEEVISFFTAKGG